MSCVRISVTNTLNDAEKRELRRCALDAIELIGKNRTYVEVLIEDGLCLHRGDEDNACAFCEVRVMGEVEQKLCNAFAARLSADIQRIARTDPLCTYLCVTELRHCYTDGQLPPGH